MGNSKSNFSTQASTAIRSRLFRSAVAETEFPENDAELEEKMQEQWRAKTRDRRSRIQTRRRSVSVHVQAVRRQSSMVHENLVKINLFRNIRHVYDGLDASGNQLGEGTWGQVRLVTRRDDPSRKAAVKILQLNDTLDDNRMLELRSEITLLQKIDHPHIARLYETYEDDGLNLYLVMEYLSGGELFDRVIDLGYFKESKAADAVKQMVGAVSYLHSKGIVHRDLKLENFMYRSKDSDNLVLIDFGLSTRYWPKSRNSRGEIYMKEMVGSSYYMAPEVMRRKYGHECDMWSIGVIAYMLLSGHPPFAGDTDAEIMRRVRRGTYHFNHSAFKRVSEAAKDFVSRLLRYDPQERMSAKDALTHEWLSEHKKQQDRRRSIRGSIVIGDDVIKNLKNFVHTNRFKKLALQAVAYSANYEDIAHLQQIFEDIDQDQDGYITLEELENALKDNPDIDSEYIEKIFDAMDVDKMQKVHLNEFIAATMNKSIVQDERVLMEAFRKLDISDTGEIDEEDLRDLLGKKFNQGHVELMMREFTQESKKAGTKTLKKVTKKDFIQAMRRARINNTEGMLSFASNLSLEDSVNDSDSDPGQVPI